MLYEGGLQQLGMTIMNETMEEDSDLTFRPLTEEDIDSMIAIDEMIVQRKRSELFREQFLEQIATHGEEAFGAFVDEETLAGFVACETKVYIYGYEDLSAWIVFLAVDPNFQGQGIGKALMQKVIDHYTEKGIKVIRTICQWNWGDLVEFFSSVGFKQSSFLTLEMKINKDS